MPSARLLARALVLASALTFAGAAPSAIAGPDRAAALVDAAKKTFDANEKLLESGRATAESVYVWSVRWLDAERDRPAKGRALAAAFEAHRDRMVALHDRLKAMVDQGIASTSDLAATDYFVLEAEQWLARKKH
ncbi:MAG TPA: hypothetical protein VHE35_30370 [Kofleriaceae bacterium]|nr:hypothetical protein [Kofleriaceae bacterium]